MYYCISSSSTSQQSSGHRHHHHRRCCCRSSIHHRRFTPRAKKLSRTEPISFPSSTSLLTLTFIFSIISQLVGQPATCRAACTLHLLPSQHTMQCTPALFTSVIPGNLSMRTATLLFPPILIRHPSSADLTWWYSFGML